MKRLVVDAGVAVHWFLRENGPDGAAALNLLAGFQRGAVDLYQPPHWMAEIAAVLARLNPGSAPEEVSDLLESRFHTVDGPEVYRQALSVSARLNHPLFDTLYHAVALCTDDAYLVTVDAEYFSKAAPLGKVVLLQDYAVS
jgi:predicted nucleic acid-binding protein